MHSQALAALLLLPLAAAHPGDRVEAHVRALASQEMEGRLTGSEGARRAADYIAAQLQALGLQPLPGQADLRLPFEFTAGVDDAGSTLSRGGWSAPAGGVRGLSFSESGSLSGELVFAGYGISVPDSQGFGYDSYQGLDVKDRIAVVLRYFPGDATPEVKSVLARYSGLRYKALNARERGAVGLIVVTGPRSPNAGQLVGLSFDSAAAGSGIVAASVSGEVAQRLFESSGGRTLEQAQAALDSGNPHVAGFALDGPPLKLAVALRRERRTAHNVVGWLPAAGDASGAAAVLLGAHYDHLGRGDQGNSLAGSGELGAIHAGADDNASGVAAVLEIARLLQQRERRAPVAVAFWSGEEMGLLGSAAFVEAGLLPPGRLLAYLNFDMVGRMRDERLTLQAVGTSSVWPRLIEQTNVPIGFDVQLDPDPYLPTDVTSFNQAGVPSLSFFTGSHAEYHRPADRPETLNYPDLSRVAAFGALLAEKLTRLEARPDFVKVARTRAEGGSRDTVRAFTGTIPDYASDVDGLLLSGVVAGGPAEQAGLRAGDLIVEFAGQKIANIYDYTYALDVVKVGEPIQVVYERGGERRSATLTPRARR